MFFFFKLNFVLVSLIFTIPFVLLLIHKKIKKRYYKVSNQFLLTGKGMVETHTTYLEKFKVQNIKLKQTIFQRRSHVADVIFQTASGKIILPCIAYKDAMKLYNETLVEVQTNTKSWM